MKFYSECLRKKVYRTREFAEKMAERYEKERGTKLYVYDCPHCFNYHMTKQPRARVSQLAEELG